MKILPSFHHRQDTAVVINPRWFAVVLDKQTRLGVVISDDLIEQVVKGPIKTKLAARMLGFRVL